MNVKRAAEIASLLSNGVYRAAACSDIPQYAQLDGLRVKSASTHEAGGVEIEFFELASRVFVMADWLYVMSDNSLQAGGVGWQKLLFRLVPDSPK